MDLYFNHQFSTSQEPTKKKKTQQNQTLNAITFKAGEAVPSGGEETTMLLKRCFPLALAHTQQLEM